MNDLPLEYVLPGQARSSDFHWLGRANASAAPFNRVDLNVVYERLKAGTLHILRMKPPAEGIVLVEVVCNNGINRLLLYFASGKGIASRTTSIARQLQLIAEEWGCEAVETLAIDPRFARAIMRSGAQVEATVLVLPVGVR